jgi:hypothetical protein
MNITNLLRGNGKMKKIFSVLCVLLAALFAAQVFAAEGTTWSYKRNQSIEGKTWVEITAAVTTAADGSYTAVQLGGTAGGQGTAYDVRGMYLFQVKTYYGGTAVTADSNLVLYPDNNTSYDILNGAGADMIDDNTNKTFQPWINSSETVVPIYAIPYMDITGNSVDSATHTIIFQFIQ